MLCRNIKEARILFVTHHSQEKREQSASQLGSTIKVVGYAEITDTFVKSFEPECIVSRVYNPNFDILDIAERLSKIRFQGAYLAIAEQALPKPEIILNEAREKFPEVYIGILPMQLGEIQPNWKGIPAQGRHP